jgi:hypothetical protein
MMTTGDRWQQCAQAVRAYGRCRGGRRARRGYTVKSATHRRPP